MPNPNVFAAGNYFGVSPYHSRFDGFSGALIIDQKTVLLGHQLGIDLTQKAVRHLDILSVNNQDYLLVTINNKPAEVYQITNKNNQPNQIYTNETFYFNSYRYLFLGNFLP